MDKDEISCREFVRRSTEAGIALAMSPFSMRPPVSSMQLRVIFMTIATRSPTRSSAQ